LGLPVRADADLAVSPRLTSYGSVKLEIPEYAVQYRYGKSGFTLKNLSDKPRRYNVDLSALGLDTARYRLRSRSGSRIVGAHSTLTLAAQEEAHWTPLQ
jgi:hypothetical protein